MYLIVTYKPDQENYVRGCLMERFYADFSIRWFESQEAAIDHIVKCRLQQKQLDAEYEFWVIQKSDFEASEDEYGDVVEPLRWMSEQHQMIPSDWEPIIKERVEKIQWERLNKDTPLFKPLR